MDAKMDDSSSFVNEPEKISSFKDIAKQLNIKNDLVYNSDCTLHRDTPIKGCLYITSDCCIFHSNHLSFKTLITIKFDDIVSIKQTKISFVSGIEISSDKEKNAFTGFQNTKLDVRVRLLELFDIYNKSDNSSKPISDSSSKDQLKPSPDGSTDSPLSPSLPKKTGPVVPNDTFIECGCEEHLEVTPIDKVYDGHPIDIFCAFFEHNSTFMENFLVGRKNSTNYVDAEWDTSGENEERMIKYTVPLKKNAVGPREADMEEIQTIIKQVDNEIYIVKTSTCAPYVPYGDCFDTVCRYCITANGRNKCRVKVSVSVVWRRSVMMIQGYITKQTYEGVKQSMALLEEELDSQFLAKGRRDSQIGDMESHDSLSHNLVRQDSVISEVGGATLIVQPTRLQLLQKTVNIHLSKFLLFILIGSLLSMLLSLSILFSLPERNFNYVRIPHATNQKDMYCYHTVQTIPDGYSNREMKILNGLREQLLMTQQSLTNSHSKIETIHKHIHGYEDSLKVQFERLKEEQLKYHEEL